MSDTTAKLRALHANYLDRNRILADLPEELRAVAKACQEDENHTLCQWAHKNLSKNDWAMIRAAEAEEERRKAAAAETLTACQRRDEAALKLMFPGHFAFYELVASPPEFEERPVDAVVTVGISGNLASKANKVMERAMAREVLKVPYGGPNVTDYSPNKYAARNNTETFFHGYYTPEIEARMAAPRPHRDRLGNSRFTQSARRRDVSVSIVRDWLVARNHSSVRFLVTGQSAWPEYALLIDRYLGEFDTCIDTNFDVKLTRDSNFLMEMCALRRRPELWLDYEFYVNTLFPLT